MKWLLPIWLVLSACGRDPQTTCAPDVVIADVTPDAAPDATVDSTPEKETSAPDTSVPDVEAPACPWEDWADGLGGGRVDMVAFDPRSLGTVWASSGSTLLRSTDSGLTWLPRSEDVAPTRLAFPPDDPKALIAASGSGLWSSDDTGRHFDKLALGGLNARSLLLHPASPQRVFVGTNGGGILRSDDSGAHFTPVDVGVPRMYVAALDGPEDDATVVLATGLLQSDTYGPASSGVILRSADGGLSWTTVAGGADVVSGYDLSICPSDPKHALAAVRNGVLESKDGGLTWDRVALLGTLDALSIAWAANTCDSFWVSVYQRGVYRVDDGGLTLTGPAVDGFDFELARFAGTLAAHPADPSVVLVATHAGLYRSADGGFHWSAVPASRGLQIFDLAAAGGRVWMATWGNGLWTRTADEPWAKDPSVMRDLVQAVVPDPRDPSRVIVGALDAWFTSDGPGEFVAVPGLPNLFDAVGLDAPSELVLATQAVGVQRTSDPRAGSVASNQGLSPFVTAQGTVIDARALVVDPHVPDRLYVGLRGDGVALSDDRGVTWTQPDNTLRHEQVLRLRAAYDVAADRTRLFALVAGRGVWVSIDRGLTWSGDNDGFDSLGIGDIAVDPRTGRVYASEGAGPIRFSDDGHSWKALDRTCLPVEGWGRLAIVELDGATWLVAVTGGNRVIRHRL